MSRDATKGAITYDVESSWGEDVAVTPDWRLPILGEVDVSGLTQAKLDPQRVVQRRNECTRYIPGPKGGSFKTKMYITGRGSSSAGAVSLSSLSTLLSYVFGYATRTATAGTTCGNDWDVDDGTTAASGTLAPGGIIWIGEPGDGAAGGQPTVVQTHVLTQLDVLVALPLAPANTDAIYVADNIYGPETASDTQQTLTGLRFWLQTANLQYEAHGCFARSVTISGTNPNELLTIEIEWGVSWWEEVTGTFPNTTATDTFTPLPNARGSFNLQVRGTKTRATRTYRSLSVTWTLGIAEQVGPGGVDQYQSIVGAKRTPDTIMIDWTEDSEAATASPALAALWAADSSYHALIAWTLSDGKAVAFYAPSCEFTGPRPPQSNGAGINVVSGQLKCGTGTDTTSELTLSAGRLAIG